MQTAERSILLDLEELAPHVTPRDMALVYTNAGYLTSICDDSDGFLNALHSNKTEQIYFEGYNKVYDAGRGTFNRLTRHTPLGRDGIEYMNLQWLKAVDKPSVEAFNRKFELNNKLVDVLGSYLHSKSKRVSKLTGELWVKGNKVGSYNYLHVNSNTSLFLTMAQASLITPYGIISLYDEYRDVELDDIVYWLSKLIYVSESDLKEIYLKVLG